MIFPVVMVIVYFENSQNCSSYLTSLLLALASMSRNANKAADWFAKFCRNFWALSFD